MPLNIDGWKMNMSFFKWSFLFSEKKTCEFSGFRGLLNWFPFCENSHGWLTQFLMIVHGSQGAFWVCLRWTLSASCPFIRGIKTCPSRIQKVARIYQNDPEWHLYHILLAAGTQDEHQVYQTWWIKGAEANDLLAMCTFIRILRLAVLQPKFYWVCKIYLDLNAWTFGPSFTRNWWWSSTEICI